MPDASHGPLRFPRVLFITPATTDVCERYYRLDATEIATWPILSWMRRRPAAAAGIGGTGAIDTAPGPLRRIKTAIFGDGLPERGRLSPALASWIEKFRPDVIYTILGSTGIMEIVDKVQRRFDLPLVIHFMDDWQSAIYRGGLLSALQRRHMRALIAQLVARATARLAICDAMCAEYAERFGQNFRPFQNAVDTARWGRVAKQEIGVGTPIRLLYAGSVLGFRSEICRAVRAEFSTVPECRRHCALGTRREAGDRRRHADPAALCRLGSWLRPSRQPGRMLRRNRPPARRRRRRGTRHLQPAGPDRAAPRSPPLPQRHPS